MPHHFPRVNSAEVEAKLFAYIYQTEKVIIMKFIKILMRETYLFMNKHCTCLAGARVERGFCPDSSFVKLLLSTSIQWVNSFDGQWMSFGIKHPLVQRNQVVVAKQKIEVL